MRRLESRYWRVARVALFAAVLGAFGGCGGGGGGLSSGGSQSSAARNAGLTVAVKFPALTRDLPSLAESAKIDVTDSGGFTESQTLNRPTGGGTLTANFFSLAQGQISVTTTAFTQPDAQGAALAVGSTSVQATAGTQPNVNVSLSSTIAKITLTPTSLPAGATVTPQGITLLPGTSVTLVATAYDKGNSVVPLAPSKMQWSPLQSGVASVDTAGNVTAGTTAGDQTITFTDLDSGMTGTLAIHVLGAGAGIIQGTVTAGGTGLKDVKVETYGASTTAYTTNTGDNGAFALSGLPNAQYVITFSKCGFVTTEQVTVLNSNVVTVNATLPASAASTPASPPVIQVDTPAVDQTVGQAIISGTITLADPDGTAIIVNGNEAKLSTDAAGKFRYVAILSPGSNSITVRSTNCQGTTLSTPVSVSYTPSGNVYFKVTLTWDGPGDLDLHTWDPNNVHCYYNNSSIASGSLDVDNTVGFGPENFTNATFTPGRYSFAVDSYSGAGTSAVVQVTVLSGPNRGQTTSYGPYKFTSSDSESGYPVTGSTASWWRAVDVIVGPDGVITATAPDNSPKNRAVRALYRNSTAPRKTYRRR